MKAVVVYQSLWGNTAAVAAAIAEGLGEGACAISTGDATAEAIADADLVVAGAPLLGFSLPTERMLDGIRKNPGIGAPEPDLSHPLMRTWLAGPAAELGRSRNPLAAAFETAIWWSPGSSAKTILKELEAADYRSIAKGHRFVVSAKYGPLRKGEIEAAREWGAELARLVEAAGS
jgi:hypothetical protein